MESASIYQNKFMLVMTALLLMSCSSARNLTEPRTSMSNGAIEPYASRCWSEKHFVEVDLERAQFIQFVDEDLVLYRTQEILGEGLSCAYPTNNRHLINRAKELSIPYRIVRWVTP